jgi:hypothetical protein
MDWKDTVARLGASLFRLGEGSNYISKLVLDFKSIIPQKVVLPLDIFDKRILLGQKVAIQGFGILMVRLRLGAKCGHYNFIFQSA